MPKFRKKPDDTVYEATQWFPGVAVEGVQEIVHDPGDGSTANNGYGMCVTIHGQPTKVEPGDWVMTEPDGEHYYPIKPDIFADRYEAV